MSCLHQSISNWGTPQARCDSCGATFDWRDDSAALAAGLAALEQRRDALDKAITCIKELMQLRALPPRTSDES